MIYVIDLDKVKEENPKLSLEAKKGCLFCCNCGQHFNIEYPINIIISTAIAKAFRKIHKNCKKKKELSNNEKN
jgi:hypothetical protein